MHPIHASSSILIGSSDKSRILGWPVLIILLKCSCRAVFLLTREHVIDKEKDLPIFFDKHPLHSLYQGEYAYSLVRYKRALTGAGLSIRKTFAPYDSNINLFPSNRGELRKRIGDKLKIDTPQILFDHFIIPLLNIRDNTPGRLYSFFGSKP